MKAVRGFMIVGGICILFAASYMMLKHTSGRPQGWRQGETCSTPANNINNLK